MEIDTKAGNDISPRTARVEDGKGERPPHVVWILCDQLRWDAVGFTGNPIVQTPNLDRLAARGAVLENLFVSSSVCMPSRAAMLTGRYPNTIRMGNGSPLLDPRETTLPEILRRQGYCTGMFGKLHVTPQQYTFEHLGSNRPLTDAGRFLEAAGLPALPADPVKRDYGFQETVGFEDMLWGNYIDWLRDRDPDLAARLPERGMSAWSGWEREGEAPLADVGKTILPAELHPSAFIAESAIDFFSRRHAERPCFMQVSFVDPHHPWDPPGEIARRYPIEQMPLPCPAAPGNVVLPPSLAARRTDFSGIPPGLARKTVAYYYAMIETVDRAVGRLVSAIEAAGELENTIFVFAADHGELLGDYGLWRKGSYHYDCMIRVPCFISWPRRIPSRQRIDGLIRSIDLTTTLLGLLGQPVPAAMQGTDWSDALRQETVTGHEWVYCELYNTSRGPYVDCWTVRTPRTKLNYYPSDRTGHLFDLGADPREQTDLYSSPRHRGLREAMTENLLLELRRQRDPLPISLSQF